MEAKGGIMRIGIDLDNTILSYTGLFHALAAEFGWIDAGCPVQKDAIKDSLKRVARSDGLGELRWQRLQARVYGPDIDRAPLFDGFAEFVAMAREKGWALVIVSHKTEVSNLDPTVNLRRHARRTLAERGFFDSVERGGFGFTQADVYFENERIDKVRTIARLSLTHFIDDMPQVLEHEHFPRNTQPILCHDLARATHGPLLHLKDWHAVRDYFTWAPALADFNRARLLSIAPLAEGGNNRIFKLETASGPPITLKRYHRDPADPAASEREYLTRRFPNAAVFSELREPSQQKTTLTGDLFHFAGHCVFNRGQPNRSYLQMAGKKLYLSRLRGLRFHRAFINLASCQSGTLSLMAGNEPYGFVASFFAAGAVNILASLWELDDEAAGEWMTYFYRNIDAGLAEAHRQACLAMRARRSDPWFWAGMTLLGKP